MQLYGDGAWDQWRRYGATGAATVDQVAAGIRARRARRADADRLYRGRFERLAPAQRQFMLAAAQSVDDRGVAHISPDRTHPRPIPHNIRPDSPGPHRTAPTP
ncbi:hypothetical protein BH24ACT5_BH24ACT5_25960 [soil metagenome]